MLNSRWRELAGRALGIILDLGCRARYQITARGLENFTRSPSTLVVFNHRRDADTPIIGNILFGRRGLFARDVTPIFVAREDLFRRGFLASYLQDWPPLLRKPFSLLSLRPFLWALQAYPLRRIAERTLGEVLEDVLRIFGNLSLDQVLKPDWVEQFERLARDGEHPLHVKQVLRGRYQPLLRQGYGLTKLTRERFRALKPFERATIESQLQLFVEFLEQGKTLQLAPEGAVSRDGRFARIRAGLHVLLNRPRTLVRVLPVGITYDFMTTGRQWVFVNVGQEMTDLRGLKPSEASARVMEAILAQSTITASQLASQYLRSVQSRGGDRVSEEELLEYVSREAHKWAEAGLYVDPRLLSAQECEERVLTYLEYCLRSGELVPDGRACYRASRWTQQAPASWAAPGGAINYVNNELTSLAILRGDCLRENTS